MCLIIVGKTCSGKDSIVKRLCKDYGFENVLVHTTRPIRKNEKQDAAYHFVSDDEFNKNKEDNLYFCTRTYNTVDGEWRYGYQFNHNDNNKSVIILPPSVYKDYLEYTSDGSHVSIYIYANNNTIRARLKKRGDKKEEAERRILADNEDFKDTMSIVDRIVYNNEGANINDVVKKVYEEYCKTTKKKR